MVRTKTLTADTRGIAQAAQALVRGELVAIPTETVYGLAAVCEDEVAVAQIFAVKERPSFDPLIVHVPKAWASLEKLTEEGLINPAALTPASRDAARVCMQTFWPGALTLILPRGPKIRDLVTSGLESVGIRVPDHPVTQTLLSAVGKGLAAPSANRFGRISPTSAADVLKELGDRIPWILDGGPCAVGLESTVLAINGQGFCQVLRPGGVSREALAATLGTRLVATESAAGATPSAQLAPGMLASHYAPRKPLTVFAHGDQGAALSGLKDRDRVGVLLQSNLSPSGDLAESARNLFAALRRLDEDPATTQIAAELAPTETGLGHAINDRLRRAGAIRD